MNPFKVGDRVKSRVATRDVKVGDCGIVTNINDRAYWGVEVLLDSGGSEIFDMGELLFALDPPKAAADAVKSPSHYVGHASGIECIEIVQHENFCIGNAIKYLWRHKEKGNPIQDLEKAKQYIDIEISRLKALDGDNV